MGHVTISSASKLIVVQQMSEIFVWLVASTNPSEKYEFVSWDDDIPNWMEK